MIPSDLINVLAVIVCFLVLVVTCNHVDLQVRVKNILDLHLKTNKEKKENSEDEDQFPS
ncbi:hypothetical protein BBOR36S_04019 [Brevibacillus borstelensis]|jgi:hypothetical protein|nr:hypothetical protein BBO01nite_41790 [Brevibacillus borstelensis]